MGDSRPPITKRDTKPICVGRFLLDLPVDRKLSSAKGASSTATVRFDAPVSQDEFKRRLAARWESLRQRTTDDAGKPRVKPPESVDLGEGRTLFNFDHSLTRGPDVTGKVGEWLVYTSEGHAWRDGVAYTVEEGEEAETRRTILELRPMATDELPSSSGFCGPRAFFAGPGRSEFGNFLFEWAADVPMALRVSTSTYIDTMGLNSLRPPKPDAASLPKEGKLRGHLGREGTAAYGGLAGREWTVGFTEQEQDAAYVTSVTAVWFSEGAASSPGKPAVQVKLSARYRTVAPPKTWGDFPSKSSEEEFNRVWQETMKSFRLRPGGL